MVDRRHRAGIPANPPPAKPFTPRSLPGMSNSCRKWIARVDLLKAIYGEETKTWDRRRAKRELIDWSAKLAHPIGRDLYRAARNLNRVAERLRPCPGCKACGVRRFSRVGGFEDGTAFIEHRPGRCRMFRVPGKAWKYSGGMRRSMTAEHYPLSVCENYVASGQWEELTKPICSGAGLLPARRKARR